MARIRFSARTRFSGSRGLPRGRLFGRLLGRSRFVVITQQTPGTPGWHVVVDDEEAKRELAQLRLGLSDLRSFWPMVVPLATGWWREQFETEGRFGSGGWSPLAPSTVLFKSLAGLRPQILQATGSLKQDASRPTRSATPRSLTLTIDNDYLRHHQTGTDRMPTRPLIFESLPLSAERELQGVAEEYVEDLLGRF